MDLQKMKRSDALLHSPRRPSCCALHQTYNGYSRVLVDFRVRAKVSPGHLVCLVGSSEELGAWDPLKARIMKRSTSVDSEWHKEVSLTRMKQHLYRYFICRPLVDVQNKAHSSDSLDLDMSPMSAVIIHKWESHIEPRTVNTSDILAYGILPITEFGWIADQHSVGVNGWFLNTTEIRLTLSGQQPIKLYGQDYTPPPLGIKCCVLDCGNALIDTRAKFQKLGPAVAEDAALNRFLMVSSVSMAAFRKMIGPAGVAESVKCQQQQHFAADMNAIRFGTTSSYEQIPQDNNIVTFFNGQSLTFYNYSSNSETLGFRFEFYCEPYGHPKLIGTAFLLPFERDVSFKLMQTPIFGIDTSPIGLMSLNCLIVRPTPGLKIDMRVSYQNYWKNRRTAVVIMDNTTPAPIPRILSLKENTLASLKTALLHDVQFIEFNVQLCKDKVPVIYHDFRILLSAFNKVCRASEIYSVLVKDLSLDKLQSTRLNKFSEAVANLQAKPTGFSDFHPFPTLCAALSCTNSSVGFIIVVKYPQCLDNGKMEVDNYFDCNTVADVVVSTVMKSGSSRKIIFASSDANTCIMLQKKQNKYPVIYQCQAMNSAYPRYKDFRARSLEAALHFAVLEKLLGVDFLIEELIKDTRIVRKTHGAGLILFAWSDKETVRDPYISQIDAVVSHFINFNIDFDMKREVFHFSNRKEEIDLTNASVVMGIKRNIHSRVNEDIRLCKAELHSL